MIWYLIIILKNLQANLKKIYLKIKIIFLTKQFRNFIIGGASAFIIDFGILNLITYGLNYRAELLGFIFIPNVISTVIPIIYSFNFQRNISFKAKEKQSKNQFLRFISVHGFNLVIFNIIIFGIILNLNFPIPIAKIIVTFLQMFSSFLLYKFFVFKTV